MSTAISSAATPNYPANQAGNGQSTPNVPAPACEALHGLAKGLGALADGMDRIFPHSGDVLRGAQRKLDDLQFCPAPHDPNDLPFDPGHRTSPELNSDEKMLLKQQLEESHKRAVEVINQMGR
jgi:hypothetical protein